MGQLHDRVREHICSLSDEDLIAYIVTGIDTYEPEAVEFAREEFQRRELGPAKIAELEARATSRVRADRAAREEAASSPLDLGGRVKAFFLGALFFGFISILLRSERFRSAGEDRKAAETWKFGLAGIFAMIVALVIQALLLRVLK